jgi:hypothetical protein
MSYCSLLADRSFHGCGPALKIFFFAKWFVKRNDSMRGQGIDTAEQTGRH